MKSKFQAQISGNFLPLHRICQETGAASSERKRVKQDVLQKKLLLLASGESLLEVLLIRLQSKFKTSVGDTRKTNLSWVCFYRHGINSSAHKFAQWEFRRCFRAEISSAKTQVRERTNPKSGNRPRSGPHLVSWRGGRRLSTITGLGGGLNEPGSEGPVLCCRPGTARVPAGADNRGREYSGLPGASGNPAVSPSSRSHDGPPPRSPLPYPQLSPSAPRLAPRSTYGRWQRPAQGAALWWLQRSGRSPLLLHNPLQCRPPCLFTQ